MNLYELTVRDREDNPVSLETYRGKVLLIVNTATGCGFTPQYTGLQKLYDAYRDRGFEILDFPCNQFANQAPGSIEEIQQFCTLNYGTTFPRFAKIDVNGAAESPLYAFLKSEKGGMLGDAVKWNFTKFLIDRDGRVVKRFAPMDAPESLTGEIEALL